MKYAEQETEVGNYFSKLESMHFFRQKSREVELHRRKYIA